MNDRDSIVNYCNPQSCTLYNHILQALALNMCNLHMTMRCDCNGALCCMGSGCRLPFPGTPHSCSYRMAMHTGYNHLAAPCADHKRHYKRHYSSLGRCAASGITCCRGAASCTGQLGLCKPTPHSRVLQLTTQCAPAPLHTPACG